MAAYEALVDLGSSTVRRVRFHPEFEVDLVDSNDPRIYVTQTLIPRVVVFAPQHELARPLFADLTTQNMMAVAEDGDDLVRLRYDGKVIGSAPTLLALVQSLATPENSALGRKGFGLDYAATVGALYGICRNVDRGIPFRAQQDRMLNFGPTIYVRQTKLEASDKILIRTSSQSKILVKGADLSRFRRVGTTLPPTAESTRSRT